MSSLSSSPTWNRLVVTTVAFTVGSFLLALGFSATDDPGTMSIEFGRFSGLGVTGLVACITMGLFRSYREDRHRWNHFGLRLAVCTAFLVGISIVGFRLVLWPELSIDHEKYRVVRRLSFGFR